MLLRMMLGASLPVRTRIADRRALIIGGAVIAVIVGAAVLRELVIPGSVPFDGPVDALDTFDARPNFMRPLSLLIASVGELVVLSVAARVLDRRGWRPMPHALAIAGLAVAVGMLCASVLKTEMHIGAPIVRSLISGTFTGLEIYALWVLAFRYPQVVDDARLRALEADRLRRAAELSRLREHLQPHFLRNTLNAISAFVTEDPDAARDLLAALGDLLSDSLEASDSLQTLGDEIAWLRRYSEIFEARHRGALRFTWDLDPAASAIRLPRLLLQPVVENAIHHGALARPGGGEVTVQTRRTEAGVIVVVTDDGPGVATDRPEGIGLHLVRERLALECPGGGFRLESSASGTRAIVELA
jgi:signal transduction histidine kinase